MDAVYMNRIPIDIIINRIIPYTYNIQPTSLLEDIRNYYTIKSKFMDEKYDITRVKLEILVYMYSKPIRFDNILDRQFQIKDVKYNYDDIKKYSIDKKFSILFGLFTKEERILASNYIIKHLHGFIVK